MIGVVTETRSELRRWLLSGAIVLLAHGAVAAAAVHWRDMEDPDDPASAMVVDLAPFPMSPTTIPLEIPPGPEQIEAEAAPEKPVEKVEEKVEERIETKEVRELMPELARAIDPEIAVAALPPEPKPLAAKPAENHAPAPVTTAPQMAKVDESPVAAAPQQGKLNNSNSNAIPNWKRQVASLLERNKRYPSSAQARGEKGTAQLAFSLDRQGRVTSSRIVRSSGSAALDNETLELVRRAQPFPVPPVEMAGTQIDLTVPIRFNMK